MKQVFKENSRGKLDFGWLKTAHSFSFGEYYHPEMMGFGTLRVINDDIIAPGMGFSMHPHSNMEIITIPLSGSIAHKDSMGNSSTIKTGEVQAMSAGTGILHSEFNPDENNQTLLFQIWIETKKKDIQPQYNQKKFDISGRKNKFQLLVSPNKNDDTVFINQDAYISRISLKNGNSGLYKKYNKENGIYFLVINGKGEIRNQNLDYRDAICVIHENNIEILSQSEDFDILILEIPMN